jgi:hypothetical protein
MLGNSSATVNSAGFACLSKTTKIGPLNVDSCKRDFDWAGEHCSVLALS